MRTAVAWASTERVESRELRGEEVAAGDQVVELVVATGDRRVVGADLLDYQLPLP